MGIPCYFFALALVIIGMLCISAIFIILAVQRSYKSSQPRAEGHTAPIPEVIFRLPSNIRPINYKIHLGSFLNDSHPRTSTFHGECFIKIQALQNTSEIQLHIMNLNISLSKYYKEDSGVGSDLPEATPNNLTDIVVYNLNEALQANVSYILHYKYTGSMSEDMRGYYRSTYKTSTNDSKWFFSTQFQPIGARSVFPCFDEPNFKATFDLSLSYDNYFWATGPTRLAKDHSDKYKYEDFRTTAIMPTNLLNFIISQLPSTHQNKFSIYHRPHYESQAQYGLDWGVKLAKDLREYFYENFTTTTEHTILLKAFPNSAIGESLLLYDDKQSTLKSKQAVATIVAYELAQLLWGNLVTCKWWSYNWLNEGFASYFQYFGTHLADSTFDMPSQFVVNVIQPIMNIDATNNTYPMSNENTFTKADISRMFTSISFDKGAAFIHMTKYILGEENFRNSLNEYLSTYAYKNTIPSDLLTIWQKYWPSAHQNFSESYFNSFTTQVGYPVVTFNRTSSSTVEVSQKRFLLKDFDTANPNLTYTVPITYATGVEKDFNNLSPKLFLQQNAVTITLRGHPYWVIGNIQGAGYYRVNYDSFTWSQIRQKLVSRSRNDIHELNRAQMVDDMFSFARAGEIDYRDAIHFLGFLSYETDYLPLTAALNGLSYLKTRLGKEYFMLGAFIIGTLRRTYNKLGFKENTTDTTLDIYNRANILDWSCENQMLECSRKAKLIFDENIKNNSVPVNIRSAVYCSVLREGNENDFTTLIEKYKNETVASEKVLILNSFSCVKKKNLVDKVFQIILSDDVYPEDKSIALINLCIKNYGNVDLVFDFIDKNIDQLANAIGGYSPVASLVYEVAEHFTTEDQLNKLVHFIQTHTNKFGYFILTLQSAVKNVESNLKWAKEKMPYLRVALGFKPFKKYS